MLSSTHAHAADAKAKPQPCVFSDAQFDFATDVHAFDHYYDAIAQLLKQEKFSDLDCLADAARSGKTRFPGGSWKLTHIYVGLEEPRPGHATQQDWLTHLQLLNRWQSQNPGSITARIALAESYVNYAWDARGNGYSDSVSASGWQSFADRLKEAKNILDQASSLSTKCPQWYLVMLDVAQGEDWDLQQKAELLKQAVAFAPDYPAYYRNYSYQLLPKWSGEEGDAARFAAQSADKTGGDDGDILYFQVANKIVCACEDSEFSHFSWERVQRGFTTLEKKYGPSLLDLNSYALMAIKSGDWVAADPLFKRIGDNWSTEVWSTKDWFESQRDTAAQIAPAQAKTRGFKEEASANVKTVAGEAYRKDVEQKLSPFERSCVGEANGDFSKFEFMVQIGKTGTPENAQTDKPNAIAFCMMRALFASHVKNETPFPPPPHDSYWLELNLDPAVLSAAK